MLVKARPEIGQSNRTAALQKDSHNERHKWTSDKQQFSVPEPQMPVLTKLDK